MLLETEIRLFFGASIDLTSVSHIRILNAQRSGSLVIDFNSDTKR